MGSGNATLMLVAPAPVRTDIMRMAHDSVMSGHLDKGKTMSRVRQVVYCSGMGDDVAWWCAEFFPCARKKPGPGKGRQTRAPPLRVS